MTQRFKVPKIIVALLLTQLIGFAAHAERVLMFYSSIGMGHLSAARAIEQNLKEENPNTEVMLYNIRDTIDPKTYEQFDEWLFWKVVKTFPNKFDQLFQKTMKKGMLSHAVPTDSIYSEEKMLEVINSFKPTHIISTHYGSTQKMIALRNKGSLLDIPIAWLHTDYFKGYFPRISKNIEMTFLGIDALMKQWTDEGVSPERIKTTGLPVNSSVFTPVDKEAVFKEQNLDPNKKTIVLMSGGEGVGNFPEIIKSISENVKTPIQIIAVCAKNKEHVEKLTALKPTLPQNVDLRIHGFVKNDLVLNWIKASDLYITKSGGLSPTEGFAINKPIVLLDVYGGHERENANLFERLGLAIVNRNEREIGKDVLRLMNSPELADKMLKEQLKFRNSFNLNAINRFVFNPSNQSMVPALNFGVESGTGVIDAEVALEKLERASPADIEIVLSYGKSDTGKVFRGDTNPFGHLAIKIDGTVYTMNGRAKKTDGENLVFETKLSDYLYSVERFIKNMEHTDAFGSAYARDNISLRVSGVSAEQKRMMLEYFAEVNNLFVEGKIGYNNANFNCADLIANALKRAGINSEYGKRKLTLPLDVLSDYKDYFENDPKYTTELALYQKAPGSKNIFKSITFPISIYQLPRSLKNLIFKKNIDPFEAQVTKRISIGVNDKKAYFENLDGTSSEENKAELARAEAELKGLNSQLDKLQSELVSQQESIKKMKLDYTNFSQMISETDVAKLDSVSEKTKSFSDSHRRYQEKMDEFIKTELNFLIQGTRATLMTMQSDALMRYPHKKLIKLKQLFSATEENYKMYMQNLNQYGLPKDGPLRTVPYRSYYFFAKDYIAELEKLENRSIENLSFWSKATKQVRQFSNFIIAFAKMSPEVVKFFISTWFYKDSLDKNSLANRTTDLFKKFGAIFKFNIKIHNSEIISKNLELARRNKRVVNLFVPNHSHPIYDGILMSNLGLDNVSIVAATDQIVGKSIADRVNDARSVVTVGRGADLPIQKIMTELKNGGPQNILIYPEGSVSAGIYDTRPLRTKFSDGLIKTLIDGGYEVNIVPITYKNAGRFLSDNSIEGSVLEIFNSKSGPKLEAVVSKEIPSEFVRHVIKQGQPEILNTMIRANWLENLDSTGQQINGLLKANELMERLRSKLKINIGSLVNKAPFCAAVFKE